MLRKNRAQSSSLFLMELILAILFFSITSAVCVQFFVKSHLLSQESQVLTQAVNECSTIAEILRTSDSLSSAEQLIAQEYPDHDFRYHGCRGQRGESGAGRLSGYRPLRYHGGSVCQLHRRAGVFRYRLFQRQKGEHAQICGQLRPPAPGG